MNWVIFFLLLSLNASANIFGNDDRVDTKFTDAQTQDLARSVPALVPKNRISRINDKFLLSGNPLKNLNFCSDENFSQESIIANCSGSLIAPDKVLTAAHCFSNGYDCETYSVVFDYQVNDNNKYLLDRDQVFQCKKIIFYDYDQVGFSTDLAVIELDRPVQDRAPVRLSTEIKRGDSLFMIGYPLGISQKVVQGGNILTIDQKNVSFRSDLDTFSVNSGGPIFNEKFEQVGVLVRGTGLNYEKYNNESCNRWSIDQSNQGFADANDLTILPPYLLNQH